MSSFISDVFPTTIPSGSALTPALRIKESTVVAIVVSAAVSVTFQGSLDNVTFYDIHQDNGTEYTVVCSGGCIETVDLNQFLAPRWIKVRNGTSSSPTTVSIALPITVVSKEI